MGTLARRNCPTITGNNTLFINFTTMSYNGKDRSDPKKRNSNIGVTTIPNKLLNIALHNAVATFPPTVDVSMTHMFTVVGKQDNTNNPSNKGLDNSVVANRRPKYCTGKPKHNGQTMNSINCTRLFNFILYVAR